MFNIIDVNFSQDFSKILTSLLLFTERTTILIFFQRFSSWSFGVKCFFGGAGCDSKCGVRGTMFVLMYTLGYLGTASLTRFSEGATYVAVVYVSYCNSDLHFLIKHSFQ